MPIKKKREKFSKVELELLQQLCDMDADALEKIFADCPMVQIKPDEVVLRKDEKNTTMFILLDGSLNVFLTITDDSKPIAHIDPGQTIGEISVIDGNPTSATIVAKTASKLLEVREPIFWLLVNSSHKFAINLLRLIADRIRKSDVNLDKEAFSRKQLRKEVFTDSLTEVFNRRWLDEIAPNLVQQYLLNNNICLCMIDLDHFKRLNDQYGHDVGDLALKQVAAVMSKSVRPTDFIARYGGEEFVVLLIGANLQDALVVSERIRKDVADSKIAIDDNKYTSITISIGVTQIGAEEQVDEVIIRADSLMYRAKTAGRNRVEY